MNINRKKLVEVYTKEIVGGEVWDSLIIKLGRIMGFDVVIRNNEVIAKTSTNTVTDEEFDNIVKLVYEQKFSDYKEKKLAKRRLYRYIRKFLMATLATLAPKVEETLEKARQKYGLSSDDVRILKKLLILHLNTLAKLTAKTLWKMSICIKVLNDPMGQMCLHYALLDMKIMLEDLDFEELLDRVLEKVKPKKEE